MKLGPEQIEGAKFLASKNYALLADEMGIGKTAQAIHACDLISAAKILVICPAVARINWFREFDMWSIFGNEGFEVLEGGKDYPEGAKIICSYEYITEYTDRIKKFGKFDTIIVDECHMIKEPEAKRTSAIYGVDGIIRYSKRMWLLSGTPAPNNYAELWPLLYTFGLTPLKYVDFIKLYCNTKYSSRWLNAKLIVLGSKTSMAYEIKAMLDKIMIRRLKEDVIKELPPITYDHIFITPCKVDLMMHMSFIKYVMTKDDTPELEKILKAQKARLEDAINTYGTGDDALVILESMFESVSTLRRYTGLQKIDGIVEQVTTELNNKLYNKVVIFAIHQDVIEALKNAFRAALFDTVILYGKTPPATRQKNIDRFQNNPNCRIFIGNIAASGVAITLTAAHEVIMAEWTFTPGSNAQAIMRVHRRTQICPVRVRFAIIQDSIDDKISYAYKRKAKELTAVFKTK